MDAGKDLYKLPNEVHVGKMTMPGDFINEAMIQSVQEMKPRQGDVIVASYLRSGIVLAITIHY